MLSMILFLMICLGCGFTKWLFPIALLMLSYRAYLLGLSLALIIIANGLIGVVVIVWAVFALARGSSMPTSFKWVWVASFCETPFNHQGGDPGYNIWNYMFWMQWSLIATAVISTFCPIGAFTGIAIQVAVALVSIPLICRSKKAGIVNKVKCYQRNALLSRMAPQLKNPC